MFLVHLRLEATRKCLELLFLSLNLFSTVALGLLKYSCSTEVSKFAKSTFLVDNFDSFILLYKKFI